MKRRIVSIICIMFLLFTATTPLSVGGVFSYAEDNITLPTQEQKIDLGMMTYYNYRKGWFTSQTPSAVPALLVRYAQQFFDDPANNTGINSMAELADTISLDRSSGHWKVTITNQGLTFLDHLTKWMLGKDEFPDLYSGGSWGNDPNTNEVAYDGYMTSGCLYYMYSYNGSDRPGSVCLAASDLKTGGAVRGMTGSYFIDYYLDSLGKTKSDFNDYDITNSNGGFTSVNININFFSDVTYTASLSRGNSHTSDSTSNSFLPHLRGLSTSAPTVISGTSGNYSSTLYCARDKYVTGNYAYVCQSYNGVSRFYYGLVSYCSQLDSYIIRKIANIDTSTHGSDINSAAVNLKTNDFDKQDLAGDPDDPDTPPSVTFTPVRGTDPSVNNTYNNETVNNFYNEYVNNYTTNNSSVINEGDIINPDDPDDPDQPSGGTTPPWDNSSGAGTLTPDGNGGYTFNLPDLTIPDLNIDWNLRGLSEKFPFSIPWDLMAFFTVLNAEPETPAIEAQIDLGIVDWDIDWDLHNFDTLAALLRNLEFIGFCLALILITRSIIKG